jgi:dolichyl-phosphate-mannose-protein mannosyltransferase
MGRIFFDVHPPFAKLLFVFFAIITGVTPTAEIGAIGTSIHTSLVVFRLLPILFGIALPVIVYFICKNLKLSLLSSFAAGIFIALENSLIVQSRFVLTDMILTTVGFLVILFYLQYRNRKDHSSRRIFLLLSAIVFACTIGTKWTGLFFIAPIVVFELYDFFSHGREWSSKLLRLASHASLYLGVALILYVSFFAIHFKFLPHSGPGDGFMNARFQKTLIGNKHAHNPDLVPPSFPGKFVQINTEMFNAHMRMTSEHSYSSKFYTWPLMMRPIYYWYQKNNTEPPTDSRIYLIGNPVVYWGGTMAMLVLTIIAGIILVKRSFWRKHNIPALFFIVSGFLGTFLPFIFIGRVMFLYHYAIPLIFSVIGFAYLFDLLADKKERVRVTLLCIALVTLVFFYFSPLTYGLPLTPTHYESLVWFKTWK